MPEPTTEANITISFVFMILFKIINSGSESAVTAIINARVVPIARPFSVRALTSGMTPAVFEYNGIPINVAKGTAYHFPAPAYFIKKSAGTYP